MNIYTKRKLLPEGEIYLTDGGLETTLIFHRNMSLPHFASFPLINDAYGRQVLRDYYADYINVAKQKNFNFILESATWRANTDWGYKLGYAQHELDHINRSAIFQLQEIRNENAVEQMKILISGCVGPRKDGYITGSQMDAPTASAYHHAQINALHEAGADFVSAITMNYTAEAMGIVFSARSFGIPVVISFTVETDGMLPSGERLKDAVETIDNETGGYPSYYMINCAHPSHFQELFSCDESWKNRIRGIRANASCKSHAELDESETLDAGDKVELALHYRNLRESLPQLSVLGGCCGTDHTHMEEICTFWDSNTLKEEESAGTEAKVERLGM